MPALTFSSPTGKTHPAPNSESFCAHGGQPLERTQVMVLSPALAVLFDYESCTGLVRCRLGGLAGLESGQSTVRKRPGPAPFMRLSMVSIGSRRSPFSDTLPRDPTENEAIRLCSRDREMSGGKVDATARRIRRLSISVASRRGVVQTLQNECVQRRSKISCALKSRYDPIRNDGWFGKAQHMYTSPWQSIDM